MTTVRIADIEHALARNFPPEWAEDWDRVGLLVGDPDRLVTGVVCALDPTREALAEAVSLGANVLVTHHPAFLTSPDRLVPSDGAAGIVFASVDAGVALVNAHTNLDRAPRAGRLLGELLDLVPEGPVEQAPMPMLLISVFVPPESAQGIISAMTAAGAGRVGDYVGCAFTSAVGAGEFTAPETGTPYIGSPGERSSATEVEVRMVAPRRHRLAVLAAARSAHPYEEPVIVAFEAAVLRSSARMGMLCCTREPVPLGQLADRAHSVFGARPRVWGNPHAEVERVVTATGSGGGLMRDVRASGASVLIAGEVRYHDALEAVGSGLSVIELGHDVSEWPLVDLLRDAVLSVAGIDQNGVHVLPAIPGWWTP
ncbi:MAG: hypothetical protein HGA39_01025 [Coriobacteriia bacterium]|nr:hypothetical protein [Coriobacteriia bacterium]